MEYFVDTERVSLDYSEDRLLNETPAYRLTLYDKHGHFDSEIFITGEQINDLVEALDKLKNKN